MEIEQKHEVMVKALCKDGMLIMHSLSPKRADLIHMALGLAGEVGELVDAIKKHTIYEQKLDEHNVLEELGDIEFYLSHLRDIMKLDRKDVLEYNLFKLSQRYPQHKFRNIDAEERKDKQ
jgi:NTP pyrophosphatase (non-canonical NTP hydrolase)